MIRLIDPPKDQWDRFTTSLTPGERKVAELFDAKLSSEWEIYVQPHLNGNRPDIVLLNPFAGIAVFEIKDWSLATLKRNVRQSVGENPIQQIQRYEDEIFHLYCPRLDDFLGKAAITSGLIFTMIPQSEVDRILSPTLGDGMRSNPSKYPISGSERVEKGDIARLFPENNMWGPTNFSRVMSNDTAEDLRGWLRDPDFSQEQRKPLNLNRDQREIATERTASGYRRVKGPAGSGKSLALAARAAVIASQGKRVLVCSYNITLMNYLHDLVARHNRTLVEEGNARPGIVKDNIDYRHFHGWCKWICAIAGRKEEYDQLWQQFSGDGVLNEHMATLVSELYAESRDLEVLPRYDAILVDEGQDFRLPWWQTLRDALKPEGEMLLVADKTQDVYGTASAWTEKAMTGAGFSGPWKELTDSYRLPHEIGPILEKYAQEFLLPSREEVDLPKATQLELGIGASDLRWVQVRSEDLVETVCFDEVLRQMRSLQGDTAIPDMIFLAPTNELGLDLVNQCESHNMKVISTFGRNEGKSNQFGPQSEALSESTDSRRRKLRFFLGDARVKATTLHSFKGWEARNLVVAVSRVNTPKDRALFYTALTRLKRHTNGSKLTIVSSCSELSDFGRNSFPDFEFR